MKLSQMRRMTTLFRDHVNRLAKIKGAHQHSASLLIKTRKVVLISEGLNSENKGVNILSSLIINYLINRMHHFFNVLVSENVPTFMPKMKMLSTLHWGVALTVEFLQVFINHQKTHSWFLISMRNMNGCVHHFLIIIIKHSH